MEWKSFFYGVMTVFVLLLATTSFGFVHMGKINVLDGNVVGYTEDSDNIPEKCKLPNGQDLNSWKEHLGHHAETQDCLKYFN